MHNYKHCLESVKLSEKIVQVLMGDISLSWFVLLAFFYSLGRMKQTPSLGNVDVEE